MTVHLQPLKTVHRPGCCEYCTKHGCLTDSSLTCTSSVTDADGETPTIPMSGQSMASIGTGDTIALNNTLVSPTESVVCRLPLPITMVGPIQHLPQ